MNEAAIGLVGKAKAKLEKFYNKASLVQTTAKAAAQEAQPFSFVQIKSHSRRSDSDALFDVAPPPTALVQYKNNDKAPGVMGMMDGIVHDPRTGNLWVSPPPRLPV